MTHTDRQQRIEAHLSALPETMLWTLYDRAREAKREDGIIKDPKGIEICDGIDFDYDGNFGGETFAYFAKRAQVFDQQVSTFINEHPNAVVVCLGDGLETQQFRIDAPDVLWVSVDVPEAIALRENFITPSETRVHIGKSAFDTSWFDSIPTDRPVIITAQGLFMYFDVSKLAPLFHAMAERFSGAKLLFDFASTRYSNLSKKGWERSDTGHRIPDMPWGVDRNKIASTLSKWVGYELSVDFVKIILPRGNIRWFSQFVHLFPFLLNKMPGVCWTQFK